MSELVRLTRAVRLKGLYEPLVEEIKLVQKEIERQKAITYESCDLKDLIEQEHYMTMYAETLLRRIRRLDSIV